VQNENEIMEAMEGLDSHAEEPNLSIRAVAKLADSEEVRKVPVTVVYTVGTHGFFNHTQVVTSNITPHLLVSVSPLVWGGWYYE